jgi:hypothetical protein
MVDDAVVFAVLDPVTDAVLVAEVEPVDVADDVADEVAEAEPVDVADVVADEVAVDVLDCDPLVVAVDEADAETDVVAVDDRVDVAEELTLAVAVLVMVLVADALRLDVAVEDTVLDADPVPVLDTDDVAVELAVEVEVADRLVVAVVVAVVDAVDETLDDKELVSVDVCVLACSHFLKSPEMYWSIASFINLTVFAQTDAVLSAMNSPSMLHVAVPELDMKLLVLSTRAAIKLIAAAAVAQLELLPANFKTSSPPTVVHPTVSDGRLVSHTASITFSSAAWSSHRPSLRIYCVPESPKHDNLPWNELVTVLDAVDVSVVTTIVDVAVVVSVVKSQAR